MSFGIVYESSFVIAQSLQDIALSSKKYSSTVILALQSLIAIVHRNFTYLIGEQALQRRNI